ncbi:MAG TPA: iron ABC transporter substrate-binding protein [Nocardioides sp.]|uniref:iron ABC transporter substrate-binding protein n=1 Tax=Nocardioides sp. TaxID=35761 RepID=UPI002E311D34|nr:iron ABC transporter substrate-binding protein [Nocardioides sp.]HEX5087794.1 iron ABC transporter substrate-binding protein [Nocardioides sp.]
MKRSLVALSLTVVAVLAATGCSDDDGPKVVVYNAQHEQLLEELAPKFEKETGIDVELRNGSDSELAAQLMQEGKASPADVFLTENSPAMSAVERAGLLAPLDAKATDPIPSQYRPESGLWTGFVARSTVLVYNPSLISEADLPASLMDLADPEYAGKVSFSPTGADFQAIVAAVLDLEGEDATRQWLEGLKANGTTYDGNNVVLEAVNSGESAIGIEYHYYWYRDQAESGDNSDNSRLYFFGNQDPGAFLSISGAGVLAGADHPEEAQRFVEFLTGEEGQKALAASYALEYPLNPVASLPAEVKPFSELQPPTVAISDLDGDTVVDLLTEVGFL